MLEKGKETLETYESLQMETIRFDQSDVIVTSTTESDDENDF